MNNYIEPPKPNYEEREPHWSPMPLAEGAIDVWVGGDASCFPEIDLWFDELGRTTWINETRVIGDGVNKRSVNCSVEIVVERAEDDDYVYIIHRHPTEGGDTGTVFRYYKTFD